VNMADGMQKDWRELCVAVTNESDHRKLSPKFQMSSDSILLIR